MKVAKLFGVIMSAMLATYSVVFILMTDLTTVEQYKNMVTYLCLFILAIFTYGVSIHIHTVCKHGYAIAVVLCAFVYVLCKAIVSGWNTTRDIHKRAGSYIKIYMLSCNKFSQAIPVSTKQYKGKYEGGK